jgi:hypothetical protein
LAFLSAGLFIPILAGLQFNVRPRILDSDLNYWKGVVSSNDVLSVKKIGQSKIADKTLNDLRVYVYQLPTEKMPRVLLDALYESKILRIDYVPLPDWIAEKAHTELQLNDALARNPSTPTRILSSMAHGANLDKIQDYFFLQTLVWNPSLPDDDVNFLISGIESTINGPNGHSIRAYAKSPLEVLYERKKKPNKAVEPTIMAVTDAAAQPPRQP